MMLQGASCLATIIPLRHHCRMFVLPVSGLHYMILRVSRCLSSFLLQKDVLKVVGDSNSKILFKKTEVNAIYIHMFRVSCDG